MPAHPDSVRVGDLHWGHLEAEQKLRTVGGVFPRADAKASIEKMKELEMEELTRQMALLGKVAPPPPVAAKDEVEGTAHITIDDFAMVENQWLFTRRRDLIDDHVPGAWAEQA